MAMKEGTRQIWDYIVAHDGEDFTAQNIADATGLGVKSVNGSVTSFQKKGLTLDELWEVNAYLEAKLGIKIDK